VRAATAGKAKDESCGGWKELVIEGQFLCIKMPSQFYSPVFARGNTTSKPEVLGTVRILSPSPLLKVLSLVELFLVRNTMACSSRAAVGTCSHEEAGFTLNSGKPVDQPVF